MAFGNAEFGCTSVASRVTSSTTVSDAMVAAVPAAGERLAGSLMRSQLTRTASASRGVWSLKTRSGRNVTVQLVKSALGSNDSARTGTTSADSGSNVASAP